MYGTLIESHTLLESRFAMTSSPPLFSRLRSTWPTVRRNASKVKRGFACCVLESIEVGMALVVERHQFTVERAITLNGVREVPHHQWILLCEIFAIPR
jgi:hypothetical protein